MNLTAGPYQTPRRESRITPNTLFALRRDPGNVQTPLAVAVSFPFRERRLRGIYLFVAKTKEEPS